MKPFDLTPTLRLSSTSECFVIQKLIKRGKDKKTGKLTYSWDSIEYFISLEQAVQCAAQRMARESKKPMPQAIGDAVHVLKALTRSIEATFTVTI